jgi:hypothetical protein
VQGFAGAAVTLELLRDLFHLIRRLTPARHHLSAVERPDEIGAVLRRVLGSAETTAKDRAEAFALLGRN